MRDSEFIRAKVPMTKEEVRAISLDKLELHRAKRMLDVGSGTGSVTIQAARTYPELEVVAASEEAIAAKDLGTMKAVWVLVDVMKKKQVEEHFPTSKEEYPVRIVFYGEGEIFDILYISEAEVTVVNNLFSRKKIDSCGHIIVVENPDYISAIHIADVIGYCVVKEGGEVEYYQYSQGGSEE